MQAGANVGSEHVGVQLSHMRDPDKQLQPLELLEEEPPEELTQMISWLQRPLGVQHNNPAPPHLRVLPESTQPGLQPEGQMILLFESQ